MKKMMDMHPFILPRALSIFAGLVLALGLPSSPQPTTSQAASTGSRRVHPLIRPLFARNARMVPGAGKKDAGTVGRFQPPSGAVISTSMQSSGRPSISTSRHVEPGLTPISTNSRRLGLRSTTNTSRSDENRSTL